MINISTPERDFLLRTGMINAAVYAGIQGDHCVVSQRLPNGRVRDFSLCNHACIMQFRGQPTGGNYVCGSSIVFAKGSSSVFAPRETLVRWTANVAAAHAVARDMFFTRHFGPYCEEFHIPPTWAAAIKAELTSPDKLVEDNEFGGNPEMLEECPEIIADCRDAGLVVNLTTTGRRWMLDEEFAKKMATRKFSPNILAFSFDDVDPHELVQLAHKGLDAIKTEWKGISPMHGQRQKAFEGIFAARLMQQMNAPAKILFNVVAHPGNIGHLDDILATLVEGVPGSLANPYPVQVFGDTKPLWTPESLPSLHSHILNFIEGTLAGRPGVTRRLHYYLILEAAFRLWEKTDPYRLCQFMSGIGAWDCTARSGAYRYVQFGKSIQERNISPDDLLPAGGHIGDYWNPRWAFPGQIGDNIEELAETITTGVVARGKQFPTTQTSGLMPRLMFDEPSAELGLPHELVPTYLLTRLEFAGF